MSGKTMPKTSRVVLATTSSVALMTAGMFLVTNGASGSTPAAFDSGTATCTTDSTGNCNGPTLRFTPNAVTITAHTPTSSTSVIASQVTAQLTTGSFRPRFRQPSGAAAANMAVTYSYFATQGPAATPNPTPTPTATQTPTPTSTAKRTPSQVLDLSKWYLTIPVGTGSANMIMQPKLGSYTSKYFFTNSTNDGVVFHAPVQGTTTSNSSNTRSELRETSSKGTLPWGWSAGSGTHIMTAEESITHLPGGNGKLSFAQIHGPGSTWYLILDALGTGNGNAKLVVKDYTGKASGAVINPSYRIGTRFNLTISAVNGVVGIDYNGVRKVTTRSTQTESYFKLGAYNQSAGDFGEVVVHKASVTHR